MSMRRDKARTPGMSAWTMARGISTSTSALLSIAAITAAASWRDRRSDESERAAISSARSSTSRRATTGSLSARRRHAALDGGAVPRACHSDRSRWIVGESMAPTMKRDPHEKPHGNPHDSRKLEKLLSPDKTPAQRLGESEDGQNTSSGGSWFQS